MLRAKLDGSSEGNTLRGVMVPQRNKDRFPHCKTAFYIVQFAIATRPVVALPAPSIDQCVRRKLIRVNVKTGPSRQLQRSVMNFSIVPGGPMSAEAALSDRPATAPSRPLMSGNEAVARAVWEA
ncbi:MAG TPA: hypothetical protein PL117_18210, partial [Accumulibacter sp.]|uniref:hypothetical protein n=1 Tax=Accumulibacter sp. TaxID=2053492 RepID=UPI002CD5B9EC